MASNGIDELYNVKIFVVLYPFDYAMVWMIFLLLEYMLCNGVDDFSVVRIYVVLCLFNNGNQWYRLILYC